MELIDFSSGASYFESPAAATTAAIEALHQGKTKYGPTEGALALREVIADRYRQQGIQLTPDHILITPGSKHALFNLLTVLLQANEEVIIPTPAWFGFHALLQYSKGSLKTLPTFLNDNYAIKPEALQEALTEKTRILLLTNPGNPTGRLYSKEELEAILNVTAHYPELYIISDEIYDFDTYGKPFTSILSCKGAKAERTCIVNGFSKTFSMSGWRIGYIVGPPELIKRCTDFQGSTISGVSLFIQEAALAAMERKESILKPMLVVLEEHRSIMQQGLETIPHVHFYLPDGAYYFFPDFSAYMGCSTPAGEILTTSIQLCQHLREQFQLQLSPGDYFGTPGHARMSFAVEKPVLEEGLSRLKQALATLGLS